MACERHDAGTSAAQAPSIRILRVHQIGAPRAPIPPGVRTLNPTLSRPAMAPCSSSATSSILLRLAGSVTEGNHGRRAEHTGRSRFAVAAVMGAKHTAG